MSTRVLAHEAPMRKAPRQARSRETVAVIVAAAARVLGERGWGGFSTNAVAERAGVSIGSLYQYFPDKHALIAAVRRAHLSDVLVVMERSLDGRQSLERRIEALVQGLIAAHSEHPGLHRALLDEAPGPLTLDADQEPMEARYMACYEALVATSGPCHGETRIRLVAQVLSDALDGAIHNAARRSRLQAPGLAQELVDMACAYLRAKSRRDRR